MTGVGKNADFLKYVFFYEKTNDIRIVQRILKHFI